MKKLFSVVALALSIITPAFSSPPSTFSEAKVIAKQKIYQDQALWGSCIAGANGRGLENQVVVSMLSHAALKPGSRRTAQSGLSGNTSFQPGHLATNANAGRTVVERIA
ncbi:hypothetical protein D3C71_453600 [compost metagenome]